jgi:YfdX protein
MAETISSSSTEQNTTSSGGRPAGQVIADLEQQRRQADQRTRPEVEAHRRQAQQEAENTLDTEAIAAVQQTERALNAIAEGRMEEALAAIEQATGKVNVLLSRNPATALIPVSVQVNVIDTAPENPADIVVLRDAAEVAVDINDLPGARTLLDSLRSEIRVRFYHVPLATYPVALQEAARLLDQKRIDEAGAVLLVALNTLAIIDQVTPLPTLLARQAVNAAQAHVQKDKDAAQGLLELAQHELERGMELGYARGDEDYLASLEEIKKLRKQLKANEDTTSPLAKLKEKLAALIHRQPEKRTQRAEQEQPRKAA